MTLFELVWQAIKRGDLGVAYGPHLRRQHLEGVAGMWRFTAATSTRFCLPVAVWAPTGQAVEEPYTPRAGDPTGLDQRKMG